MRLIPVMDEIAERIRTTVNGVNQVFAYPPGTVSPPSIVVSYPEITTHGAYARGMSRWSLPLWVVVGNPTEPQARERIAGFYDEDGAESIIEILEQGEYTTFDVVTVTKVTPEIVGIGGTDYLAAVFTLDIVGSGS